MRLGLIHACHPDLDAVIDQMPPLGLAYLSAVAKRAIPGIEVVVERRIDDLIAHQPDIIGISYTSYNAEYAARIARQARECVGAVLIAGGVHITALPESLDPAFHAGVTGEGEETFAELLQLFAQTRGLAPADLAKIAGLCYYDESGHLCQTPPRPFIQDLSSLPHPDRNVLRGKWAQDKTRASIISSRGCPFRCAFCSTSLHWGQKLRYADEDYIVEEIESIIGDQAPRLIIFQDDLFTTKKSRVLSLMAKVRERGLHEHVAFHCSVRSDCLDEEILEALVSANANVLYAGIESASDKVLQAINKKTLSRARNEAMFEMARQAGVTFSATYILGTPGETREDIMATLNQITDYADILEFVYVNMLVPLPGTVYWKMSREAYGLAETDLRGLAIADNQIGNEDHYILNDWLYLNEANMSREEFKSYLYLGHKVSQLIINHSAAVNQANPRHHSYREPDLPLDAIARRVPILDILKAKVRRRLG